jgi:hypothetical protein
LPVKTQLVASIKRTVATPRIAKVAEVTVVLLPEILVVIAEQVIVSVPEVLLYKEITSPAAKTEDGIVIPADKDTTLPTSAATRVVVVELTGMFKYPSVAASKVGSVWVTVVDTLADWRTEVPAPLALP